MPKKSNYHKNKNLCRNCLKVIPGKRKYCNDCKNERPWLRKTRNMEFKKRCIEYLGGKCEICGYNDCVRAMNFHHKEPIKKSFNISGKFHMPWNKVIKELRKCVLLCNRCHAEVHAGLHPEYLITSHTQRQRPPLEN